MVDVLTLVRDFLVRERRGDADAVTEDTPLVTGGLIDSVALVQLAALLERHAGIRIPDRDLSLEHFDSVAAIRAYLAARTQA